METYDGGQVIIAFLLIFQFQLKLNVNNLCAFALRAGEYLFLFVQFVWLFAYIVKSTQIHKQNDKLVMQHPHYYCYSIYSK